MTTATEYRRFLDECLHWADKARSPDERKTFLQMAKTWHEAAIRLEQSLGRVRESRERVERTSKRTDAE
jgi:hypothetical protein